MNKISAGTNIFIYPMPVILVGTNVKGRANFMTAGFASQVNAAPPMLAVGIFNKHYTNKGDAWETGEENETVIVTG